MSMWAKRRLAIEILEHIIELEENQPKKRRRRCWCKPCPQPKENPSPPGPKTEITESSPEDFRNHLGMSEESFRNLLAVVKPLIEKKDTVMRASIPAEQRLAATLRFLATGRSLQELKTSTSISVPALSSIIPETCEAIVGALRDGYLKFPKNPREWRNVADDFETLWQFPNCGGALDGKHIRISKPPNSGSRYYNYKGFCSIILVAVVNANYQFLMVDVGKNGCASGGGGVLEQTKFHQLLQSNDLNLPTREDTKQNLNFVFIGDEAFPLHKHLLKPFPQRQLNKERKILNYRLSRARRVAENAFGIMAHRFRIFHTPINLLPEKIDKVVVACCVLHNYLLHHDPHTYSPASMMDLEDIKNHEMVHGEWREDSDMITPLQPLCARGVCDDAIRSREQYAEYFNGIGSVSWQDAML
ncbi:putative nuclease HARBI1 [Engystomops pustulosus]|uniref:putative nuclease HARBI1 n=1 Tax=Engystomops pustulosus TaxID=76066 RepID=UPI003AFB6169